MTADTAAPKTRRKHRAKNPPPKVVRGIRPGVRGPAKTEEERAQEYNAARERQLEALARGRLNVKSVGAIGTSRSREAHQLQELIQQIGSEQIDPQTGWTRIEAVVRKVYAEAMHGKINAMELLFNRGWGRVPMPVKINIQAELSKALAESGLSNEEAQADPLLRFLLGAGDQIVENADNDYAGPDRAV